MKTSCLDQFKAYPYSSKISRFFNVRIKDIAFNVERGYLDSNNNLKKDEKIKILVILHLCCEKDNRIGIELK